MQTDVLVAGAGVGGISAALAAARLGCRVLLVERNEEIGGTGVHSPVGMVCRFTDTSGRPINDGIHRELLPELYDENLLAKLPPEEIQAGSYDERVLKATYLRLLEAVPNCQVWTGTSVAQAERDGVAIRSVTLEGAHSETVSARFYVDGTADGNLAALAGAEWEQGRAVDGAMQPASVTFRVGNIDFDKLPTTDENGRSDDYGRLTTVINPLYQAMKARGGTTNPRENLLPFRYPGENAVLFNATRISHVDPTNPESVRQAYEEGVRQAEAVFECLREHPAFANATLDFIAKQLGVREGRRIIGDYVLTEEDCLREARFTDMVAACAYPVDIHDPDGGAGTRMVEIPGSGYYHIPLRSLFARGLSNLLIGSRCISGTHEAHSSYRVMCSVSAIGQAAGVAAAMAASLQVDDMRKTPVADIQEALRRQGQFIETV